MVHGSICRQHRLQHRATNPEPLSPQTPFGLYLTAFSSSSHSVSHCFLNTMSSPSLSDISVGQDFLPSDTEPDSSQISGSVESGLHVVYTHSDPRSVLSSIPSVPNICRTDWMAARPSVPCLPAEDGISAVIHPHRPTSGGYY
jgi:hypothetical protein